MLQNDMGNTRIQDSATGNIMGLSPGFIPVGMKEHGGIMYIASVNKEGEGEIGTIPSPIIRDFYKDKQHILIDKKLSNTSYVSISNKIYPADKIMINLGLTVPTNEIAGDIYNENTHKPPIIPSGEEFVNVDPCDYYIKRVCIQPPYSASDFAWNRPLKYSEVTSPIISYSPNIISSHTFNKGIFKVKLASKSIANVETEAPKSLYESQSGSNYWFHHTYDISQIFPSDLFEATLNGNLKSFPTDSKPGYLQVKLQNEGIKTFGMLQRAKHPINTPFSVKINDSKYETYFPGFHYTTESGIYVARIECEIIDQQTRELVQIILPDGSAKESAKILFDRTLTTNPDLELIKTVIGFKDSERDDRLSTAVINPIKSDNTISYPQVYNQERNEFYLTNITDITAIHTQYRSSTLDKDEKAIIPYSGLFKIQLDNQTYTHWHKLTVLYYNQYNEKLGEYECIFNPQLNDVFGSNVNLKNVQLPEFKTIGKEKNIKAVDINLVTTIPDGNFTFRRKIGSNNIGMLDDGYIMANGQVLVNSLDSSSSRRIPSDENNIYNWSLQIKTDEEISIQDLKTAYRLDNQYMYNQYYQTFLSKDIKLLDIVDAELSIGIDRDNVKLSKMYTYNKYTSVLESVKLDEYQVRSDCYMSCDEAESCKEMLPKIQWSYYSSNSENLDQIPGFVETQNHKIKDYAPIQLNMDTILPPDLDTLINNFDSFKGNITLSSEDYFYFGSSYMSIPEVADSNMESFIFWWYRGEYNSSKETTLSLEFNIKYNPKPYTLWSIQQQIQTPLYKIAPYFLLTDGDKQYVNKLHLTDPIFYKCNFTLNNSIPINYIPESFGFTEPIDDYATFSYAQPQHKILSETTTVSAQSLYPGIYVFNITAPSITTLLKDHTLPISITIKTGEKESTLSPYRVAGSTQISYQKSNGYGITMSHLWPIVIYVDKTSNIDISVNIPDGQELRYQKIGLYKLDNLPEMINGDIVTNFNSNCCCLFPDYQQIVLNIADNLPKEDQYTFKQTYGIFFRQSYSYVEGLYDSSKDIFKHEELLNVIRPITVDTTTYPNKAFVPAEPYILNYMWDKTPESKEPKVSSSCSAACLYCQPKEILTNRQETKFKFFPTMENTEDCLTTQIRTFVLTDTAISCQPGNSTVLIKNNNADEN